MRERTFYLVVTLAWGTMLSLLGNWPASAADLKPIPYPVKARVQMSYQGCGTVYGLGTFAEADKATVSGGQGVAFQGYAAGGALAASFGYMCGDGTSWKAVEAMVHYQNIGSGSVIVGNQVEGSIHTKVGFTGRAMFGGPVLAAFNSFLPNMSTSLPVIPQLPLGTVGSHPYFFGAVHADQVGADYIQADSKVWRVRGGVGVGTQAQFTPSTPGATPVMIDVWAEYIFAGSGLTLGNVAGAEAVANMGGGGRTGVLFKY